MTDLLDPDSGPAAIPSNDQRPNSGLREGEIPHARVNESIRQADKTIVFGQQNRLRNGLLMEDEQLRRFHAGHDLVKFFYGGIRQIPATCPVPRSSPGAPMPATRWNSSTP